MNNRSILNLNRDRIIKFTKIRIQNDLICVTFYLEVKKVVTDHFSSRETWLVSHVCEEDSINKLS